jgi:maltodextrin utilization protein YvdJ
MTLKNIFLISCISIIANGIAIIGFKEEPFSYFQNLILFIVLSIFFNNNLEGGTNV